jgi:hypothetical protein
MGARLAVVVLVILIAPALLSEETAAEDVEVSTTFLTFFKNGGGYIEYRLSGEAASHLRTLIDDPDTMFPFENRMADGDGVVDQSEGESYTKNLDDILTRRMIVLRGVKMENVDVDEHRGLIGSKVNDTRELFIHITFRGGLQYDKMEFNISGLEPLAVLYGTYEAIPPNLTVDEKMFIVAAGMGSYETVAKDGGSLWNLRVPLAVVVSSHVSYTSSSPPAARMEYDHGATVANPLILMIFMFLITILAIKLPKGLAKENQKERVRELHLAILISTILVWLFYTLGGNAILVMVFGVALVGVGYFMGHMVYAKDWKGMAVDLEGIDLGDAISAVDPVNGFTPPSEPVAQGPAILGAGGAGVTVHPEKGHMVALPMEEDYEAAELVPVMVTVPEPEPAQAAASPPVVAKVPVPVSVPAPMSESARPTVATKSMRCKCGGIFKVPLQPRPLEVQCPHCGTSGTLKK